MLPNCFLLLAILLLNILKILKHENIHSLKHQTVYIKIKCKFHQNCPLNLH